MNAATRLLIGTGAIGSALGGAFALNKYLFVDDIQSKLKANDLRALKNSDERWEKIFESYKTVSEKNEKFKFSGTIVANKEGLQEKCKETLGKKLSEDSDQNNYFGKAKRWCTVPKVISEILKNKGRTILDTKEEDSKKVNENEWNEKIKAYTAEKNKEKIDSLDLGESPITNFEKSHRDKIKGECKKIINKQSYEEGFELALIQSENWCSIENRKD